jgi:hypothetical protein
MRRLVVSLPIIALASGCSGYYRVQPNEPIPPRATVAITFETPRDLEARRDATVYTLPEVTKVYGEVEEVRSDTLVLRVLGLESDARQPRLTDDAGLTLVPDASTGVSIRRISKARTAGVVALTVVGVFFLIVANMEWDAAPTY